MSVGVVVSLDGCQVGVIRKVDWSQKTLLLCAPETGRDSQVAKLIHNLSTTKFYSAPILSCPAHLMSVAILGIMTTQQHPSVSVIQLHADAAGRVAVARSVDKLHSREVRDAGAPAVRVGADVTILNDQVSKKQKIFSQLTCIMSDTLKWAVI